ncbi:MAG TPA: Fe-S cluster assembly ATPase SufC [Thermoplasmata archaeon]|nr:Fe-S cluster assembly ATPase SufC [Thermoplasmata archaeon]HIH97713.1 Fe-S cluster assembly ATPase SufC [Thermoplasmata archaeon]
MGVLEVKDLEVSVEGKKILNGINLRINSGETCVLLGPNGSGKSTLMQTIIGNQKYHVDSGKIIFNGRNIIGMSPNERVKLGIGISFQYPPAVRGVKLIDILRAITNDKEAIKKIAKNINMENFFDRDLNMGFSGGELKRSELLQLLLLKPALALLDEPDSGVDIENLELIGGEINKILKKDIKPRFREMSGLIITHMGSIMQYVKADRAFVIMNGSIICSGNPEEILEGIKENGYEGCAECMKQN